MARIRTLIVDNEAEARRGLRLLLDKDPDIEVVGECADGQAALRAIESQPLDLVFLDVQMPKLSGFEVLQNVAVEPLPFIVFVTAYDRYAVQAFEVHAVDYLLKPFSNRRFQQALSQAKTQIRNETSVSTLNDRLDQLLDRLGTAPRALVAEAEAEYLERIACKEGGKIAFIEAEAVDWIEAADNYVALHVGPKTHLVRATLSEMEEKLDPRRFLRIHRSRIVNVERVREMLPQSSGDCVLVLENGTRLNSSRTYSPQRRRVFNLSS